MVYLSALLKVLLLLAAGPRASERRAAAPAAAPHISLVTWRLMTPRCPHQCTSVTCVQVTDPFGPAQTKSPNDVDASQPSSSDGPPPQPAMLIPGDFEPKSWDCKKTAFPWRRNTLQAVSVLPPGFQSCCRGVGDRPVWRCSTGRGEHLRRSDVLVGRPQRCRLFVWLRVPPAQAELSHRVGPELWGKGHANYLASRADLWCDEPLSVTVQRRQRTWAATGVLTREERPSDGPNVSSHISGLT